MESKRKSMKPKPKCKSMSNMFTSIELSKLYKEGALDNLFKKCGHLMNPSTLYASGGDTTVFRYVHDGRKSVIKIAPKNIRFFKHFGKTRSAKEFKKYINRLDPFFLPVEDIIYEDENVFVYTQKKCRLIKSNRINKKVVADVFRLVQFMLVNNILLTDLAPHNLAILHRQVVVFDYHGLHRLTKDGVIKREDWWRRLARNLTRFICGLYNPKKRSEYSTAMQNCDRNVIKKMEEDPGIPEVFTTMIKYLLKEQNNVSINKLCTFLEKCITCIGSMKETITSHKKKKNPKKSESDTPIKVKKSKKCEKSSDSSESSESSESDDQKKPKKCKKPYDSSEFSESSKSDDQKKPKKCKKSCDSSESSDSSDYKKLKKPAGSTKFNESSESGESSESSESSESD